MEKTGCSERRVCRALSLSRSTHRYQGVKVEKDATLVKRIQELAHQHKRFGYRRIAYLLNQEGWQVNLKKVHRIWRLEGLRIPKRKKKKRAQGSSEGGLLKKPATRPNEVWTYDFLFDRTEKGQCLKIMPILDEFTRVCVAIIVAPSLGAEDLNRELEKVFEVYGVPEHMRSDNGPEYSSARLGSFLEKQGVQPLFIAPGSPWENGIVESFNARLRDEVLHREVFHSVFEARVVLEEFRIYYNEGRPHSSLRYLTPSAFTNQWQTKNAAL